VSGKYGILLAFPTGGITLCEPQILPGFPENGNALIKTVFFDFDGTLFATEPDIIEAYRKTFAGLGLPTPDVRIGPPMAEAIRAVMPDVSEEELKRIGQIFIGNYDGGGFPQTCAYPGIREMLENLAAAGIESVVATNKRLLPTETILKQHRMQDLIRGIYTPDGYPGEKVDKAECLRRAMAFLGRSRSECVMVGDTELDIRAGRKAGIRTVGVTWGYGRGGQPAISCPDLLIDRPDQLTCWVTAGKGR